MEQIIFLVDALLLVLVLGIQIQIRNVNKKMDEVLKRIP
jgi:hypothetical protein